MTTTTRAPSADSVARLQDVRRSVAERFGPNEPLTQTALDLIDCATGVVSQLPSGDLAAAHLALGSARAAVVAATTALRRTHDTLRMEQP